MDALAIALSVLTQLCEAKPVVNPEATKEICEAMDVLDIAVEQRDVEHYKAIKRQVKKSLK